jgi:hypothetical protein
MLFFYLTHNAMHFLDCCNEESYIIYKSHNYSNFNFTIVRDIYHVFGKLVNFSALIWAKF